MTDITYTWKFTEFEVAPSENGLSDVIKTVHWRYYGADASGFASETYGSTTLDPADPENYMPFEDVTHEWVENIISTKVDVAGLNNYISGQIERAKNPPVVSKTPPLMS